MMRVRAPAKLNLFLHIGEKRSDDFHELESLVTFAQEADFLVIEAAEELSLSVTGPYANALSDVSDNLVLRAARALNAERGATLTLQKNLPVAAGIGGGSADAGAALRGLNVFWALGRSANELSEIGATIGSDVPACIFSQPAWVAGRGEIVRHVEQLPAFDLVLVNPNVPVATATIYERLNLRSGIGEMKPPTKAFGSVWDLMNYLAEAGNDLEAPACATTPAIDSVLEALEHEPGCVLAQMSGSGATCFGLFQDGPWASGAADRILLDHPQWWVRASRIAPADFGAPTI